MQSVSQPCIRGGRRFDSCPHHLQPRTTVSRLSWDPLRQITPPLGNWGLGLVAGLHHPTTDQPVKGSYRVSYAFKH